jgi:hypothetical protein
MGVGEKFLFLKLFPTILSIASYPLAFLKKTQ